MVRMHDQNVQNVLNVTKLLGDLAQEMVFVGGAATGLLIDDPGAPELRVSLDVDAIVEAESQLDYHHLGERLRAKGFSEDMERPVCRWKYGPHITLDVMPTDPAILGFANRWYPDALRNSQNLEIGGYVVRVVTIPYFLGAKLEAFYGRGGEDFVTSRDIEDMVAVLDGCSGVEQSITASENEIRQYLAEQFRRLLGNAAFLDALPGHVPTDKASQERIPFITARIDAIGKMQED